MKTPTFKHLTASTIIAMGISTTPVIAEPTVAISGAVEVEINSGEDHTASTKGSDIALATVEIGIDAQINENVSAHVLILHEDDDTDPPVIDEGTITISKGSLFLNAGRMYIPFGNFESNMISDPLTLELAETQEAAIEFGYEANGLRASIYAFNGEADQVTSNPNPDNDVVDDFGISIGYTMKAGNMNLDFGFDYLNNMAETDGMEGVLLSGPTVEEHTAGMALHAIINMDALTVILEHVTAADDFNILDADFNGAKASPSATNIELAYNMKMGEREYTFAIAHQSTSDMDPVNIGLPESVNLFSVTTTLAKDVGFIVEYSDASDYETADGGSGKSGSMLTAQLAVEF